MDALSLIGQQNSPEMGASESNGADGPGLKELFINLTREDQVDFILRKLPRLEVLNGLPVDRNELYSSQEEEEDDDDDNGEGRAGDGDASLD